MRLMTCVLQTGSRLARLACGTKRSVRAAAVRPAADGDAAPPRARPATAPASPERVEQRPGFREVRGFEAPGERAVDRREEVVRLAPFSPLRPKPAERCRGAELPMARALLAGDG